MCPVKWDKLWSDCTNFSRIALGFKKGYVVELHSSSKKVFQQKYHVFEGVKHLENSHFPFNVI
jgi:hypothetical protein